MTTHTPGPWHLGNAHNCARGHAICSGASVIARVVGHGYPSGLGWSEASAATATLIAAAPDMLRALELIAFSGEVDPASPIAALQNIARAAIAQARGVSSPASPI